MRDRAVVLGLVVIAVVLIVAAGVVGLRAVTAGFSPAPAATEPHDRPESPVPSWDEPTLSPAEPPYPGATFAVWEKFFDTGGWTCGDRPGYEGARDLTCVRRAVPPGC